MLDSLYEFYRGGVGFAMAVTGLIFFLERDGQRVRRANGALCLAVGISFCMSVLPPVGRLPIDISNFIVAHIILVIGYAGYEMFLFLFGGQRRRGLARKVFWLGVVWTEVVWLLPLLDWVLGLAPVAVNIEHGRSVGPFHLIGGNLIFSWIVVAYPLALFHSRWRLSDLPLWARESRYMLWALCYTGGIVACLIAAMAFGSKEFYRIGNVLLETFMIAWFFLLTRKPQVISLMRREVHDNHERKVLLDEAEAATIGLRLDRLSADGIFRRPDLDLGRLAGRIQVPAYRLSRYFNEKLATSFPVWLNRSRVNWVCARMAEVPGTSLLDLALEAGYSSKTTFNTQFSRLTGMSPSEYRKRLNDGGVSDMLPEKKNLGQGVRI